MTSPALWYDPVSHRSVSYHVGHLSVDVFGVSEFSDDTCTLAFNFNSNPILNEIKVNLSQSVISFAVRLCSGSQI